MSDDQSGDVDKVEAAILQVGRELDRLDLDPETRVALEKDLAIFRELRLELLRRSQIH